MITDTTIDILAQELQSKEKRITKMRDKILEQQEYLKFEIIRLRREMKAMAEELSYSRGEHPIQKKADRKRRNGKSKGTSIN